MGYAAKVMRGLIIDYARRPPGPEARRGLRSSPPSATRPPEPPRTRVSSIRTGAALDSLASVDAALAEVVDLKFFCGFSLEEIAAMRGVSTRTVQRQWEKARIYLHREIRRSSAG